MQFSCESCKTQLQIADEKVRGKRLIVRCKRCGAKIAISDPALGAARPRMVAAPPAAGAASPAAARPSVAPAPAASRAALPRDGDSDTDSTRAMDSDLLEQALQASKVEESPERAAAPSASARPAPAAKPQPPPPAVEPADAPLWFAMLHGKQQGPLTRAELRARTDEGEVGPRTYLWKDGMDAWQRAKDLPDLQELFPQLPDAPSLPPPTAPPKAAPLREFSSPDFGAKAQPAAAAAAAKPLPAKPASVQAASVQAASAPAQSASPQSAPAQAAPAQAAPAQSEDEPTAVDPLPLGERVHQEGVGRELFAPEPGAVQKQPADLASWAASELEKKPAPRPSATPSPGPVVTPAPRMFEGAAEPRSRGPFVLVVLGVVAIAAVALWLIYEKESRASSQPPKADEARAATPGAPAPPAPVPAAAPREEKPPARPEPKAQAAASTGLTADQVRRKLDENKSALQGCIDEALRRDPNLRVGKIHIATTIAPTGAVTQTKIDKNTVDRSPLGACLRRATRKIAFPPFSGEAFDVDIPIVVTAGE